MFLVVGMSAFIKSALKRNNGQQRMFLVVGMNTLIKIALKRNNGQQRATTQ
ncbi:MULTISPECIES: hypothetical protein [Planktothrix]|jgi:hypothetical protein|uniref:hypothetical protein n=1 Tax=Planktothrix TaxID=54304 RepID=UPI0013051A13|nr:MULTISPECIES: hypothetical protein [Planktothrix]